MRKFTGQFTGRVPLLKGSWAAFCAIQVVLALA
jgi:hypothetical protein